MIYFYCPKCKADGMTVHNFPPHEVTFDRNGEVVDSDFLDGPGVYEDDDTAFCSSCSFEGFPEDFEHDDTEDDKGEEQKGGS